MLAQLPLRRGVVGKLAPSARAGFTRRPSACPSPAVANQYGPVTYIDFSVAAPHVFAVTASTRVLLYDPRTRDLRRQFTRFQETAYSGCLRHDARLLCAGGEQGLVQVFDCGSRSLLRQFRGHTKPVHACRFSPDRVHLVSASDDVTVRYWDITQGRQVLRMDGNTGECLSPTTTR